MFQLQGKFQPALFTATASDYCAKTASSLVPSAYPDADEQRLHTQVREERSYSVLAKYSHMNNNETFHTETLAP